MIREDVLTDAVLTTGFLRKIIMPLLTGCGQDVYNKSIG